MHDRKRNKNISFRVTEREFSIIAEKIHKSRMSVRDYFFNCINNTEITVKPHGSDIVRELKRIGNNINQIAYNSNVGNIVNCSCQLEAVYSELRRLMEEWQ